VDTSSLVVNGRRLYRDTTNVNLLQDLLEQQQKTLFGTNCILF
jgi:hypothetical protein